MPQFPCKVIRLRPPKVKVEMAILLHDSFSYHLSSEGLIRQRRECREIAAPAYAARKPIAFYSILFVQDFNDFRFSLVLLAWPLPLVWFADQHFVTSLYDRPRMTVRV